MKLLAFETATEACSVALWIDGEVRERFEVAPRRHAELVLPWAEGLLADAGIARSQLDAVAVGRGPGAFTGVRLGISVAQGIALALDRPVVAISTLQVLAAGARKEAKEGSAEKGEKRTESFFALKAIYLDDTPAEMDSAPVPNPCSSLRILAAIDARMGEVYAATYTRDGDDLVARSPEIVSIPDDVFLPGDGFDWIGVGTGFGAVGGLLARRLQARMGHVDAGALPHAANLASLAAEAYARGEALPPERVEPAYLRDKVALTLAEQQARKVL